LRKGAAKPTAKPAATEKPRLARAAEPARRKLSFNDKHALETLPGRIETLEAEIGRLQKLMADTTLYARDRAAFDNISTTLTAAQTELAEAEERWLELELLRGEIEGA
jgi:ATP-binding cassette subfamily F protein uup